MKKTEKLKLIEGKFSHDDARDILMNIFSAKLKFHELKNFSSQERFGKNDETAQKRIPKLEQEIERLHKILATAQDKQQKLIIHSEIQITLSGD